MCLCEEKNKELEIIEEFTFPLQVWNLYFYMFQESLF